MLNTHGFQLPVYIAKGVYAAGHVADLGPLQLGIFDKKTNSVATGSGNGKEFYLAGGSPHTRDHLTKWFKGMKQRKESTPFYGKDLEGFEKIVPTRPANEAWVLGYGGAKNDVGLQYEIDTTYKLKIRLYGDTAFYFAQNSVEKVIPLYTGCASIDDCDLSCDSAKLGVKKQTRAWVKAINDNIELAEFKIKATPIFSDYASTSSSRNKYTLTIADGGGVDKFQDVQRAYPGVRIVQKSYDNGTSIYETEALTGSPAAFTPKSYAVPVTDCTQCASGTFSPAKDVYNIIRPLAGTEDLDDATARQTFADAVKAQYFLPSTFNGATAVDPTTNQITLTGHGINAQTPLVYSNGGGTTIVGLTNGATYYANVVDANNITLSTTPGGAVVDITADGVGASHTLTESGVAVFKTKSNDGAFAIVQLTVDAPTVDLVPYLSDTVYKIATIPASCTPTAASPVSWVAGTGYYITTRTSTITVSNEDCKDAPTLAQVQAALSSLKNTTVVTDITDSTGSGIDADHCVSVFQAVQNSSPMADEYCMTSDNATFEDLPNLRGAVWVENDTTDAYDASIKAGIRITAPFYSKEFGDCSYNINERWDAQPLRMEISIYNEELEPCKFAEYAKARRVKVPKYQRLNAGYVRHEYIVRNSAYFPYHKWSADPRDRQITDNSVLEQVKGGVYYVEYRLKYKELRDAHNFNQKQQHWSPRIFVEEGDLVTQAALEAALGAITSKFGVYLENVGSY